MAIKTNAMRILDSNNIKYKEHVLDIKEALDGVTCANMLGLDLDRTFKTLVTQGKSGNYYVFVVPVAEKLDLKKAANSVGDKMKQISKLHQVICVTHQASIAAKGDYNYYISKSVINDKTIAIIKQLNEQEVINEIARIASGTITKIAINHAKELRKTKLQLVS